MCRKFPLGGIHLLRSQHFLDFRPPPLICISRNLSVLPFAIFESFSTPPSPLDANVINGSPLMKDNQRAGKSIHIDEDVANAGFVITQPPRSYWLGVRWNVWSIFDPPILEPEQVVAAFILWDASTAKAQKICTNSTRKMACKVNAINLG